MWQISRTIGDYLMHQSQKTPKIVIIGAGFAGLRVANELASEAVEIVLIDRNNYHTFTPLLYQVATCALDPSAIAYPIRSIFRDNNNVHFMLGEVHRIEHEDSQLIVRTNGAFQTVSYDYLVLATGTITNFFGNSSLQENAFELKSLNDAVELREHILRLFEKAAWTKNEDEKSALTTFVVVGGGPTGIETAGALYELYNHVLKNEYDDNHELSARVVLLEAQDRLLLPYPEKLQESAKQQLESLGVEVVTNAFVDSSTSNSIVLRSGETIRTYTIVWSAGVRGASLIDQVDIELKQYGRIPVTSNLAVIGHDNIYAGGDIAYLEDEGGEAYPTVIPVANQQGTLIGKNIVRRLNDELEEAFVYCDRGMMATIGRRRAVAWIYNRIPLSGFIAWFGWLFLHLLLLMGFRNRLSTFVNWVWNYLTYDRSVRLILRPREYLVNEYESVNEETTDDLMLT